MSQARAAGSWRTIVAPPGEHRPLQAVGSELLVAMLGRVRQAFIDAQKVGQTEYLQVVQNWGAQAGARTNHLCLDLYDLPQIPHRVAEEIGGAARFMIREGECPYCRLVREEPRNGTRMIWEDEASVAFAPYASRSPFEVWVVPRRHAADFAGVGDADIASTAEALRQVLGRLACLDGPPHNLVLHAAPLRERVDATYHWHWEVHPRLREIAGLELGTGLPVNPVSPEEAVEQLLRYGTAGGAADLP
jgi:UDPglucose--hexose-1-phosphate uridylyltransferase